MKEATGARLQKKFLDEYVNTLDIKASALSAGYGKRTGIAVARNFLKSDKTKKELKALCERKAEHLEVCPGYIILGYLKVLKWALSEDEEGILNDPALALRALDGIVKNSPALKPDIKGFGQNDEAKIPIISEIKGLDPTKI